MKLLRVPHPYVRVVPFEVEGISRAAHWSLLARSPSA